MCIKFGSFNINRDEKYSARIISHESINYYFAYCRCNILITNTRDHDCKVRSILEQKALKRSSVLKHRMNFSSCTRCNKYPLNNDEYTLLRREREWIVPTCWRRHYICVPRGVRGGINAVIHNYSTRQIYIITFYKSKRRR